MEKRRIGSLGVTLAGLGCNNFGRRIDQAATTKVVDAALEAGVNLFDTADVYGDGLSEEYLGKALGSRREDVIIATKFGHKFQGKDEQSGGSARWIGEAVEGSLRRLGTDRIDLYQMHLPDANTPIDETLEALSRLVKDGKVREIGNSNFNADQIREAAKASESNGYPRFASAQNHWSLLERAVESEVIPAAVDEGLGVLPYFPLANGLLTGKYRRGEEVPEGTRLSAVPDERRDQVFGDAVFDKVEGLEKFAADNGHSLLELAMSWLACSPGVASVIAGATQPEQVKANSVAVAWKLSGPEMKEVDALLN